MASWNIASPKVFELDGGEDVDPNAVSFAQGYNSIIWNHQKTPLTAGLTNSKGYSLVGDQITPGWVNATGATIFHAAVHRPPDDQRHGGGQRRAGQRGDR